MSSCSCNCIRCGENKHCNSRSMGCQWYGDLDRVTAEFAHARMSAIETSLIQALGLLGLAHNAAREAILTKGRMERWPNGRDVFYIGNQPIVEATTTIDVGGPAKVTVRNLVAEEWRR